MIADRLELSYVPGVLGEIARRRYKEVSSYLEHTSFVASTEPPPAFKAALAQPGLSLIAEVKRKSPSQGEIAVELEAAKVARDYVKGGARAVSVLTEPHYFLGSDKDLLEVRSAVRVPVLRKDFTVHPGQVAEARALGASAVLLIVAVLGRHTGEYVRLVKALGLDALVEVHDPYELDLALEARAEIIGINNRNLVDLKIDLTTAPILAKKARKQGFEGLLVAESGYSHPDQLAAVREHCDAVLVGTSLARSGDWQQAASQITRPSENN
ncbi:MAG: indole-3-glycerol phosphate synthase TrpC [Meiothermus sp.]|nr:indole-3-glycerol phosphate synthase TrpC [Meiothermus sp.]